jgi:hypothetical protein
MLNESAGIRKGGREMDSFDLGYVQFTGCCEYAHEHLCTIKF